jgi:hypothetical protein
VGSAIGSAIEEIAMAEPQEPEQGALFQIEGPDEDGCVWICSAEGRDTWCQNLGPRGQVVETLSQWLASVEEKDPD